MAREVSYGLLSVSETSDTDLEDVGSGSAEHDGQAVKTRGGATKYVKMFAMLVLLVGAVGIYSVASSPPKVMKEKTSDEAGDNRFYEVGEDTTAPPDSTAPPGVPVAGQMRMQVSDPAQFANDPGALQAVKESIAKIAGVPVSAVKDVKMFPVLGASGVVQADFKIDAPGDTANDVVDQISSSTPEANSQILSAAIAAAGLSAKYPETKVLMISATANPCDTTTSPENPCATTLAPVNPCVTTLAPENPCGTTQAPGMLARLFR